MFRATRLATAIWMITATGGSSRKLVLFGHRTTCRTIGRLTATATGLMLHLGDGRGMTTRLGALLPSITGAGEFTVDAGAGARDRSMRLLIMDRHTLDFLAGDLASEADSASVAASAGSRWVLVNLSA